MLQVLRYFYKNLSINIFFNENFYAPLKRDFFLKYLGFEFLSLEIFFTFLIFISKKIYIQYVYRNLDIENEIKFF